MKEAVGLVFAMVMGLALWLLLFWIWQVSR